MTRIATLPLLALSLVGTIVQAQKATLSSSSKASAAARSAAAPTWRQAYTDDRVTVSVDPKGTVKQSDGTYSAHLRWQYATDQPVEHRKAYRTMVETRLIDCKGIRTKPVRATTYDATGKAVSSYDTRPSDMKYLSWAARKAGTSANSIVGVCKTIRGT